MACRRVAISKITAKIQKDPYVPVIVPPVIIDKEKDPDINQNILTGVTQTIKPEAKLTIEQKIKEGISKKILRNLFTECDYFEIIKKENPMVYDSIKEKIKYFNPAFHSMTPEGLNARLTFLNQCTRPGQTIPIIGTDGRAKYNDSLNTSFGAPPILVLRVGDFYNTKIVPTSVGFAYEGLDLNPEGIGVQPMLVNVTMAFNIIGGMGLKEPVQQLQNALSFNYYANTEIYDERAVATEDTKTRDKYVVEKITGGLPPVGLQEQALINSVQPQKGLSTIGTIVDDTTINYDVIYNSLETKLQEYFKTYYSTLNKTTIDYSYGAALISIKDNNYTKGDLSEYTSQKTNVNIYGKSNEYQDFVDGLVKDCETDITLGTNPILKAAIDSSKGINGRQKRELQEKLKSQVALGKFEILNTITNNSSNIVNIQNELNYIFRQLDVISDKLDGNILQKNEPILYDLSGEDFFSVDENSGSIFDVYTIKVKNIITEFNSLVIARRFNGDFFKKITSTINNGSGCAVAVGNNTPYLTNCPINRYYTLMTPFFLNSDKFQTMVNELVSGPDVKTDSALVDLIKNTCDDLKSEFTDFQEFWKKELKSFEDDNLYKDATTWKLPDNTVKTCKYITPAQGNAIQKAQKTKKIKNLYSNINLNEAKKTFNGKVTFN
jgi:hypothetical protein